MPLWKLVPVVPPGEAKWLDRPVWREVILRAPNSGMARSIAAEFERRPGLGAAGNESLHFKSALEDPQLYWMTRTESAEVGFPEEGPNGVLRATPMTD